jgi:hypothetical protein
VQRISTVNWTWKVGSNCFSPWERRKETKPLHDEGSGPQFLAHNRAPTALLAPSKNVNHIFKREILSTLKIVAQGYNIKSIYKQRLES